MFLSGVEFRQARKPKRRGNLRFLGHQEVSWFCACMAEVLAEISCKNLTSLFIKGTEKVRAYLGSQNRGCEQPKPSLDLSRSREKS